MIKLQSICIALLLPLVALAQPGAKLQRIGVIHGGGTFETMFEGLRAGLKDSGLIEGKHIVFHVRNTKGDIRDVEAAARQLESEQIDVLVPITSDVTLRVKRATREVPIVFFVGEDPVRLGLVKTFAKPGDRLTGVHYLSLGLVPKRVEILHRALPRAKRVVVYYVREPPSTTRESTRVAREAAAKLGIELAEKSVSSADDLLTQVDALRTGEMDALLPVLDALVTSNLASVIRVASRRKLPVMAHELHLVELGALIGYGANYYEVGRTMAKPVRQVLGGARPANIPVEIYDKVQLALNLRVAKELGITIPDPVILRADQVIR